MVCGDFGIKLFYDRNLLLTQWGGLVHFESILKGGSTLDSPAKIFFYIKDDEICKEKDDMNYVVNLIELSYIPIYRGNNPKYCNGSDGIEIQKIIDDSSVCIYYYNDNDYKGNDVLKFFLAFSYKDKRYNYEMPWKVLSLLKYTWFTSQVLSYDEMKLYGEDVYNSISQTNVYKIVNNLKIISGEKVSYWRDNESTSFAERWIIDTDDFYIINTLFNLSEKLFPRPFNSSTHYMYGSQSTEEYQRFDKHNLYLNAKLESLRKLIKNKISNHDEKDCIMYVLLRNHLWRYRPSNRFHIESCRLDAEHFETEKTNVIISEFIKSYSIGKHIGGLFHLQSEALKVPDKMMNDAVEAYNCWELETIKRSNLNHLCIYWSKKEICEEFNNRSNKRFNFGLNFR